MSKIVVTLTLCGTVVFLAGCGGVENSTTTPSSDGNSTVSPTTPTTTTFSTTNVPLWSCASDRQLDVVASHKKGFAVDDTTFKGCFEEVGLWPHATEPIASLRLFSGWKADWPEEDRDTTWEHLETYIKNTEGKILVGVGIGDEGDKDQKTWDWAMQLMKKLGRERIMAVAFGNELDDAAHHASVQSWWGSNGKYVQTVKGRVKEMNDAGFIDMPITSAWTAGIKNHLHSGDPLGDALMDLVKEYGERWIWAHNPYSIWSGMEPHNSGECQQKVDEAVDVDFIKRSTREFRDAITKFVGNEDYYLWITETGWSAPAVDSQKKIVDLCPAWASFETLWKYYKGVAEWDLSLDGGKGVDHLFMFTLRDTNLQERGGENFGLISSCGEPNCKIQNNVFKSSSVLV